jgi:CHAT domain-containing protein
LTSRRFEVADVARALPENGVLLEFVEYQPYDFGETGTDEQRKGVSRYLTFTLNNSGAVTLTDLGDARKIDSLVNLTRRRIYQDRVWVHTSLVAEAKRRLDEITGKLYDIIFAPLESQLGHRVDIYICPDGQLNLLPLEILRCPDGRYVVEKYSISYLSSGRDLLRFKKERQPSEGALLVADPDFEFSAGSSDQQRDKTPKQWAILPIHHKPYRGVSGCLSNRFNSLPYSREEASSIAETLKGRGKLDVDVYCDSNAAEELLKEMPTVPRVLHLATHGYFCEDLSLAGNQILENPLLRSGLALAGANRLMDENHKRGSSREDGILTAFEASGLDLVGTELVALSACETGVGEVKNGEGVYGLRRAFQHAGARTIVMSLWKVPDKETCELMDGFYQNWLADQSKKEAFRQSVLTALRFYRDRYGVAHPYLWGGFVLFGDPN